MKLLQIFEADPPVDLPIEEIIARLQSECGPMVDAVKEKGRFIYRGSYELSKFLDLKRQTVGKGRTPKRHATSNFYRD